LRRAEEAELVIAVFAADAPPDAATLDLLARDGTQAVAVMNKCDLAVPPAMLGGVPTLDVAARTGAGLDALRARLGSVAEERAGLTAEAGLTRPRHRAALEEALRWLDALPGAPLPELRAEALRAALQALGRITGRVGVEAVLDLVFGEFCIGK
ncbi:MAG: tRNA uridine-5-carboxymethylaminomethyl(34) synthesis GTPase MnmE, partial [Acetobacteraceae bacterium]|nr:tRNA uridine-5-carboxymethylaminomethyl(34) synthesis GTPase MnmE [Acetobacteraceae bacterium]